MKKALPFKLPAKADLQQRFHELRAEIEAIEKQSTPLRLKRDVLVNKHVDEIADLEKQYKKIEEPLYDMKMELGDLVRALKGDTARLPAGSAGAKE